MYIINIIFRCIKKMCIVLGLFAISLIMHIRTDAKSNEFIIQDGILTQYNSTSRNVTVPETVVKIGTDAFSRCTEIMDIEIPKSTTEIAPGAFRNCASLTNVIIPDSVTVIGEGAFEGCISLKSIEIPESVTSIGEHCFEGCISLDSITIPSTITEFGAFAFHNTSWLTNKRKENPLIVFNDIIIDGVACKGTVTIPESATKIESHAFEGSGITNLILPDTIKTIDQEAFNYSRLESIIIPSTVTRIENYTFFQCLNLKNVSLPNSLTYIGEAAFSQCKSLEQITIPNSVSSISSGAFIDCTRLKSIVLPEKLTTIEEVTFSNCKSLASITIPKSTTIKNNAFYNCNSVMVIYGYNKSSAQTYAKENSITFKVLALNKIKSFIKKGESIKLDMNSLAKCTWVSSNNTIATVSSNGIVKGIKSGKVKITAKLYSRKYTCTITIN